MILQALQILAFGMVGIFMVMGIIIGVISGLKALLRSKASKE